MVLLCTNTLFAQNEERIAEIESRLRTLDHLVKTKAVTIIPELEQLRKESAELGSVRNQIMSSLVLAKGYESQKDYEKAFEQVDWAWTLADSFAYRDLDYMLNSRKGFILLQQGNNDASIEYLERCVVLASKEGGEPAKAQALIQLGYAYTRKGDFDKAIKSLDAAGEILKETKDDSDLQSLYSYMGIYYSRVGDKDKALGEHLKALEVSKSRNDTSWMISCHLNVLSNYAVRGDVEKAYEHYNEREALISKIEFPEDRKVELNIGVLLVQNEEYEKALDVLEICRAYYAKEGNIYRVALVDHWMALAYRGLDRYDLAAEKSKLAFEGAEANDNKKLAELSAFTLFQTYHWRGNDSDAIEWLQTSNEIKDSIYSEAKRQEMLALETKYETFRKEQEIEILKAKNELEKAKRGRLLISLVSSLLIGGLLIYQQVSQRKKEKEIQEERLKIAALEKAQLQERLEHKEKELTIQLLHLAQKNTFLSNISASLDKLKTHLGNEPKLLLNKVIKTISNDINANETWDQFLTSFKEIHHSFVDHLIGTYQLSAAELRLASMIKMNMSSKEIGSLLNISDAGVKKARYRLRKKLDLDQEVNMQEYLLGMG